MANAKNYQLLEVNSATTQAEIKQADGAALGAQRIRTA